MKTRICQIIVPFLFLFLLTGCKNLTKEEGRTEGTYQIYYMNSNETSLVSETYQAEEKGGSALIGELLEELKTEPLNFANKRVVTDTIIVKNFKLHDNGQLTLDFDASYSTLQGIAEVLCRSAIVKTLSQVEEVDYIEFNVNGQPLMGTDEQPVGLMSDEDFIDNTGGETNFIQNVVLTLFFANEKGDKLVEVRTRSRNDGTLGMEQLILNQLLAGPLKEQSLAYPAIPKDTQLLKVTTKDGICYVDFNKSFMEKNTEASDEVILYSIVNSLVEMSSVNKVQFLIEGKVLKNYHSLTDFSKLYERNLDIIEKNE